MGFNFEGKVLRGARIAPSNAETSGQPDTGVVRDVHPVPPYYTLQPGAPLGAPPEFVDAAADQYRAAILDAPGSTPTEYLIWAQNTASLAWVDDPSWWKEQGTGAYQTGSLDVTDAGSGVYTDGTNRIVVLDDGNRSVNRVLAVVVARGDQEYDDEGWINPDDVNPASYPGSQPRAGTAPYITLYFESTQQNPSLGVVYLTDDHLTALGGGLSQERGDTIILVHYTLAPAKFWWTRNDRYETRFGWNGKRRRWEPYKGSATRNVGRLELGQTYNLNPKITNLPIGSILPGGAPDAYGMVRVGLNPSASSVPVEYVEVVSDTAAERYDFGGAASPQAVMGQTNGMLVFNPAFVSQHAGVSIWYSYKGFIESSNGVVGKMLGAGISPLYIAPIPGPTDNPFIKFGNRAPLTPILVSTDAALETTEAESGQVVVSLSTGRLRFNDDDIAQADPASEQFSLHFLGEDVIYDGVALNMEPQPTRMPAQLLDETGIPATSDSDELYIPDYVPLPGLGVSGILDAPDGTGALPTGTGQAAPVRPGGDSVGGQNLGRVRQVRDLVGDTILFSQHGAVVTVSDEALESDLPKMGFKIKQSTAFVARERGTHGSRVVLSRQDRKVFDDKPVFFLQASLVPSIWVNGAVLYSRNRDIFRFEGDEKFYFAVDGVAYAWEPTTLIAASPTASFFTSEEVAESIQADTTPALPVGTASSVGGRLKLIGVDVIEIGFGTEGQKDLSGCAILGFNPGWFAASGEGNWLPDSGSALGLVRSPVNKDRNGYAPDYAAVDRVENIVLSFAVPANPFLFLENPPLQDVVGLDDGVFFSLQTLVVNDDESVDVLLKPLQHYEDIVHRFGQSKFDWIEHNTTMEAVTQSTTVLNAGYPGMVPESLLGAGGIALGLLLAPEGESYQFQTPDTDFILPEEGTPGIMTLVERIGKLVTHGSRGWRQTDTAVFQDDTADFTGAVGYRLKVTTGGANSGSYIVSTVVSSTEIYVSPPLPSAHPTPLTWELYDGFTTDVYDPALVADVQYEEFNLLPDEPFVVRVLHYVGDVPDTMAEQTSARLKADMAEAVERGREIGLRFGLVASSPTTEAALTALKTLLLGTLANGILGVPHTDSIRFSEEAFSLQVGSQLYQHGSDLVGVGTFSPDPAGIEYLTADAIIGGEIVPKGRIKFGSSVLTALAGSQVYYREEFLGPTKLQAGEAEYNPNSGYLNISALDINAHGGERLYFHERLVTENQRDVSISPMLGAFSPNRPMPEGAVMEVQYWRADLEGRRIGDQVIEFLPVFVRFEEAVRVDDHTYKFNSALQNTVFQDIEPQVWIGAMLQNFGATDYTIDYPKDWDGAGRILFLRPISATDPVSVTYAVYEAQGSERSYEASQKSVYKPPFYIKANQNRFGLRGDRTGEFEPGQMLRVGEDCFYIRHIKYFESGPNGPVTEVGIYPDTVAEVGSRAPGNDLLNYITDQPLTTVVNPDGTSPIVTTAAAGLMSTIDIEEFPFEAVVGGQKEVIFRGDLTAFAVPGHVLEIGGCPYVISDAEMTEDGARTKITVTGQFARAHDARSEPTVKLSYRPIYPPGFRAFLGLGPALETEPVELVLFGETDDGVLQPGRTLIPDVEYDFDYGSGQIQLLEPVQSPLGPGQRLLLSYTKLRSLSPFVQDEVVVEPRYIVDFLSLLTPSEENGIMDATLTGTYTFSNPDSFYFRAVDLTQFLGEAAQEAIEDITSKNVAGGSLTTSSGGSENWEQGRFGLKGERHHLKDLDRAARTFLEFYNNTVVAFEQIQETIFGGFVGDRDGKFRFWVGHGKEYLTPGYDDEISGDLNQRFVWGDVFNAHRPNGPPIAVQPDDWVVAPSSASIVEAEIEGRFMGSDSLEKMAQFQRFFVQNDVDDIILGRLGRVRQERLLTLPWFRFRAKGEFRRMADQHRFSRLFPTRTSAFFRTYPGAGAWMDDETFNPGAYTFGRLQDGDWLKTTGDQIGQLSNPVLGDIQNVDTVDLALRRARGRIWGYFPDGLPIEIFDGGTWPAPGDSETTEPCIIVTPLLLRDVPINPETGFPDDSQFLSATPPGDFADAETGDPEMAIPGFAEGDQISWGKPDGRILGGFSTTTSALWGVTVNTGLFVRDVQYGCVIRLMDIAGAALTAPGDILVMDTPAHEFPVERGDTLLAVTPSGGEMPQPATLGTSPQFDTIAEASTMVDQFRDGMDFRTKKDGRIVDRTLPSLHDPFPFPLKEMFGQNPPPPTAAVEGPVEFQYLEQNPLQFPALKGETVDDSGDYAVPYIRTGNTEIERFEEISSVVAKAISARTASPPDLAVYPDEIISLNGLVAVAGGTPAALEVDADLFPVLHGSTDPGIGDMQSHDLVLVQTPGLGGTPKFSVGGVPTLGPHGILTVGRLEEMPGGDTLVEPPRFVAHTTAPVGLNTDTGDGVRYNLTNAMVFVDGVYPPDPQAAPTPGAILIEDVPNGVTILDLDTIPIALNDGNTAFGGIGNLNDIYASGVPITLRMIARPDPNITAGPPGPNPLPSVTGGEEAFRIVLWYDATGPAHWVYCWTYQDDFNAAPSIAAPSPAAPVFGTNQPPLPAALDNKQIHIPLVGFVPWGAVPPNQWFLPHNVVAGVTTMLYGFEFSFNLDARGFLHWAPAAPAWESMTAWVDDDRLTFHEICDLGYARERGFTHPLNPALELETLLSVTEVRIGVDNVTDYWSTVNNYSNGGDPFTFLQRSFGVGHWTARTATETERGSLRVMAFEGWGNTPIEGADVSSSSLPSCVYNENTASLIYSGEGDTGSRENTLLAPALQESSDCRLRDLSVAAGQVENVEPGDILVIKASSNPNHTGSVHEGTYLVRHAIAEDAAGPGTREVTLTGTAGEGDGWCPVEYPTVLDYDTGTHELEVTDLAPAAQGPLVGGVHVGFELPAMDTWVYIIRDLGGLSSNTEETFRHAVISARYTAMNMVGGRGVFTVDDWRDAMGDGLTEDEFNALVSTGYKVSGMTYFPVRVSGKAEGLPENNVVGIEDNPGNTSIYGFSRLTLQPARSLIGFTDPAEDAQPLVFRASGVLGPNDGLIDRVPGPNRLLPMPAAPESGHQFLPDEATPVYHWVTDTFDFTALDALWDNLNIPVGSYGGGGATGVRCLLPGTTLRLASEDGGGTEQPGFTAQAGIFLEPSVPRTSLNLALDHARVVDADHFLPDPIGVADQMREIWMRNGEDYSTAHPGILETVAFDVRRIRRFHDVGGSSLNLRPLRYAYEIRRGIITDYQQMASQQSLIRATGFTMGWESSKPAGAPKANDAWNDGATYTGTNWGNFKDKNVNVHEGDTFRLLDAFGGVVEEVEIRGIESAGGLILAPPGLTQYDLANGVVRFEIFLRQPPVPHEQTNEQLLGIISNREIHRTNATWGEISELGGYVPEVTGGSSYDDNANKLYDDLNAPGTSGQTFSALGVRKDDIVVIDPIGEIPRNVGSLPAAQEQSVRPLGDEAVPTRIGIGVYVPGRPNPLDDNRGFYRVLKVVDTETPPYLLVNPITEYSGEAGNPVIFGPTDNERAYAMYPTINYSTLSGSGQEGQMDLRPTRSRNPVNGSFKNYPSGLSNHSIRPFSYSVIRPTQIFDDETVDLVLSTRERMLSWIELLRRISLTKSGSYFVFQQNTHLYDIGSPTDPELGLGVPSNLFLWSVVGKVDVMPYANNSGCVSLLDRRFWIRDEQLDSLTYDPNSGVGMRRVIPGDVPYTGYNAAPGDQVRPVLPDRVDETINSTERLRDIRFVWLAYRTHRTLGTLAAIARFDKELPDRLEEQERYLLTRESMEETS